MRKESYFPPILFLLTLGAYGFLLTLILFHSDVSNQRREVSLDDSGFGS